MKAPPAGRAGMGKNASKERHLVDQRLDAPTGVAQDLEPEGVERPDSDGVGFDPEWLERARESLAELHGGAAVERDRGDLRRPRRSRRDQPGDARDERCRLA